MQRTVVLNVVGLTPTQIGRCTPFLSRMCDRHRAASIGHVSPAVTCSVQATYLSGAWPESHGIIANGWYFRDQCEVHFWKQSNRLVGGDKLWDVARRKNSSFTCANLFWWFNMYSSVDYSITPRPMYLADGRKIPDVYTEPESLRRLQESLGAFPLFHFWGPRADIRSSQWIADAAVEVESRYAPTLSLVYLPHLDYALQKYGPNDVRVEAELRAIDGIVERLWREFDQRSLRVMVLSEYGISQVSRPVHLNRVLRQAGLLRVRVEMGREQLDPGASDAFAVADHQVAHVYVRRHERIAEVAQMLARVPGVARVLDQQAQRTLRIAHARAGELVALAEPESWFTYYYWQDDARAPDYARTVDIHRKPGYDPAELFVDPAIRFPRLRIAEKLIWRKLGMRNLLDVIPLDATLVRGSHGIAPASDSEAPLLLQSWADPKSNKLSPTEICGQILRSVFA